MSKRVLLHVNPNGQTNVEAEGYEGGTCLDATKVFEDMFAKTVGPREMVGECAGGNPDMGERVR